MIEPSPRVERGRARLVVGVTIAIFALPVLADLALSDRARPFGYFAADAFYYLTVARNFATLGRFTYDGTRGTNGFHPLWQLGVGGLYAAGARLGLSEPAIFTLTLVAGVGLIALGLWLLGRWLGRDRGLTPLYTLLPLGLYAVVVWPSWLVHGNEIGIQEGALPLYGTLWSYVNGMESALVICLWALLGWLWTRRRGLDGPRPLVEAAVLGGAGAGLAFARLDHAFLPALLLGGLGLGALAARHRRRLAYAAVAIAAFALPLAVYLALNKWHYGSAMPLSGAHKSSFPRFEGSNVTRLWATLRAPVATGLGRMYREAQMLLPLLAALVFVLASLRLRRRGWLPVLGLRTGTDRVDQFLLATACAIITLGLYNFCFVVLYAQGHWYFPMSTLFVSVAALRLWQRRAPSPPRPALAIAVVLVAVVAQGWFFWRWQRRPSYHARYAAFYYEGGPRLRAFYQAQPVDGGETRPCLVEVDDGIVAFATRLPALSGSGLNLDRDGLRALEQHRLVPLAVARGCRRITSLVYMTTDGLTLESPSERVATSVPSLLSRRDWVDYRYVVEYQDGPVVVVRVDPLVGHVAPAATPATMDRPPR